MSTTINLTELKESLKSYDQSRYDHDEIDLMQLCSTLWKNKKVILLSTFICGLVAASYAWTAQEWWTSKAIIAQAKSTQLEPIYRHIKQFEPAFNKGSNQLKNYSNPEFYLAQFIQKFNSRDNKIDFLKSSELFHQQIYSSWNKSDDLDKYLSSAWLDKIQATPIQKTKDFELSLTIFTPEVSHQLLVDYIHYTNKRVLNETTSDLSSIVSVRELALQNQIEIKYKTLREQISKDIERTKLAYEVAKASNIQRPIENVENQDGLAIELGSDVLEQKMLQLQKMYNTSLIEYTSNGVPVMSQLYAMLNSLQGAEISINNAMTYYLIEKPTEPVTRDKPKRALILVLGVLLGGMLGVAIVLVREFFREHQSKELKRLN